MQFNVLRKLEFFVFLSPIRDILESKPVSFFYEN